MKKIMKTYKPKNKLRTYKHNKNSKKEKAEKMLESYMNEDGTRKQTKIEAQVEQMLLKLKINYMPEYAFHGKYYDFMAFCNEPNMCFFIEVHGSYHHAQDYIEGKVPKSKISKYQKKNVKNDKYKEKLAKEKGIPLLILWEKELKTAPHLCIEKIKSFYECGFYL